MPRRVDSTSNTAGKRKRPGQSLKKNVIHDASARNLRSGYSPERKVKLRKNVQAKRLMATSATAFLSTCLLLQSLSHGAGQRAGDQPCVRCLGGCRKGRGAAADSG